ncbi:MAG TPA: TonB-dependent receptor, partial [Vicinamibacterales bacterium]
NRDDILFVASEQTGFGYFKNFGETRRQGVELGVGSRLGRATIGAGYTFLRATFESPESVSGESNSTNDAALVGIPGVEGTIQIDPGDRIPFVPEHMLKVYGDVPVTPRLGLDVDLVAVSGSFARGNENHQHQPDGTYYLGPGRSDPYAIVNVGARYQFTRWLQLIGQINNLFDRKYATGALLGPAGFTETGAFAARPLPPVDGEFPVRQTTFLAPGAPVRAWVGTRIRF